MSMCGLLVGAALWLNVRPIRPRIAGVNDMCTRCE